MTTNHINPEELLAQIEATDGVRVRGFRSTKELAGSMQQAVGSGKMCVFEPSQRTLREFLNTKGFISVMNDVNPMLSDHEVLLEPNLYGSQHLFVVGPKTVKRKGN